MAITNEQQHVLDRTWNDDYTDPIGRDPSAGKLTSNWRLTPMPDKNKYDHKGERIPNWQYIFCSPTETVARLKTAAAAREYMKRFPELELVIYDPDTDEEYQHRRAMKWEQGRSYYEKG